jgi:hypothetical protein
VDVTTPTTTRATAHPTDPVTGKRALDGPTGSLLPISSTGWLGRRWPTGLGLAATAAASMAMTLLPDGFVLTISAWSVLLAAVIYLVWGVTRDELTPAAGQPGRRRLTAQTAAVLAFGAVAATALTLDRAAGTYLLAAAWLCHAGWDLAHHRANAVVPRWYAETCLASDVVVAAYLTTTVL